MKMTASVSSALRVAKDALRSELMKKIVSITPQERIRQSKLITERLLQNERYRASHRISVYPNMPHRVETSFIIEQMFKQGKECFIPKFDLYSKNMDMVKLYSLDDYLELESEIFGMKQTEDEEAREEALSTGGLDLLLVPGLAFTKKGHRIGSGKGYYDWYVDRCLHDPNGRPYTIGLAYSEQILHSIPTEEHDFMVDEVVHSEG